MVSQDLRIRLTYYDASDGPRIMLFGPLEADFRSIQELFLSISHSPQMVVELHSQPFVVPFGEVRLTLTNTGTFFPRSHDAKCGIRRVQDAKRVEFTWGRTSEGWDYLAELIDPIVNDRSPGHQYLTSYPSEDAIVVLSKGEYGDEVLK